MRAKLYIRRKQLGITLFELLVVLSIVALLATLIAPRVVGYLGRGKLDIARAQLANIGTSLELYFLDMGEYPQAANGLEDLISPPSDAPNWRGPYLRDESGLTDPWGRPYLYEYDGDSGVFEVYTLGRDGAEGGGGENVDIRFN